MTLPLPSSPAAEQAVIGSVLLDPGLLYTVELQSADFYDEKNGWIWAAFQGLANAHTAIEIGRAHV